MGRKSEPDLKKIFYGPLAARDFHIKWRDEHLKKMKAREMGFMEQRRFLDQEYLKQKYLKQKQ